MVNQYGWTNVSVVEKDKGFYQKREIYIDYIQKNNGWLLENEQTLGLPEGRRVIYIDEVSGLSAKEKKEYNNINTTINIANVIVDVYGTYLTAKTINESPAYNSQATNKSIPTGVSPEYYYELRNNKVGMTQKTADAVNNIYGTNYIRATTSEIKLNLPKLPTELEEGYSYRGVYNGHPEELNALRGIVVPGNTNSTMSAETHNLGQGGNSSAKSPFTSWTTDPKVALKWAKEDGIILRVKQGAPGLGDTWSWTWSPDYFYESEVLLRGIRTNGIEVFRP
jgi:hypothetical protein